MTATELIDSGIDTGNYDQTEVNVTVPNVWHESHNPAKQPAPAPKSGAGEAYLKSLRTITKRPVRTTRQPVHLVSWKALPENYRRVITWLAGLPPETVDKADRDLDEGAKAAIRAASRNISVIANDLVRGL
jgi:hypothetical protein